MKTEIVGSFQTGISSLGLLVFVLMALAIVDIVRGEVKVAPKWAWIGAVVLFFPVGPVLYLLWGRVRRRTAKASS